MTVVSKSRTGHEEFLYSGAAVTALLVVFSGFARTFYLKGAFPTPRLEALPIVHGLVMTAWFVLFLVQARLVASHRLNLHRTLGGLSLILAGAMVVLGTSMAIWAARRGHTPGPPPLIFMGIPFSELVVFIVFFSLGCLYRKNKENHKRFMLMANLGILSAAIARIPLDFIAHGGPLMYFGLVDLLVLLAVGFDTARRRRLHPVFGWSAGLLVLSLPLRLWLMGTPAWMHFATWVVR